MRSTSDHGWPAVRLIGYCVALFIGYCALTGCSFREKFIDTSIEKPHLSLSNPAPVMLDRIQWIVISKENLATYEEDIKSGNLVIIGMTPEDYKKISMNTQKLANYITQQNNVLAAYRRYYETP